MKSYKTFLYEYTTATNKEYDNVLKKLYPKKLADYIIQTEKQTEGMLSIRPTILKSNTGKVIFKYMKDDNRKIIYVIGLISETKKISKEEYRDVKDKLEEIKEDLISGYTLMTSPNSNSTPILNRMVREIESTGKHVQVQKTENVAQHFPELEEILADLDLTDKEGFTWDQMVIYPPR